MHGVLSLKHFDDTGCCGGCSGGIRLNMDRGKSLTVHREAPPHIVVSDRQQAELNRLHSFPSKFLLLLHIL